MSDKPAPRRLGRGLEALLGPTGPGPAPTSPHTAASLAADGASEVAPLRQIAIRDIRPNPFQPRKEFRPEEIAELTASLSASGLLQPVTVRVVAGKDGFELIAGERRLRAATALGWNEIPAIVRNFDDREVLTLALVENLQRADLNPMEEAEGYQRLINEFSLTQQVVAQAVGKDRSTVGNLLRLLALPEPIQQMLRDGMLTLGHARALLAMSSERAMLELAREAAGGALSVRDVERRVRDGLGVSPAPRTTRQKRVAPTAPTPNAEVRQIEDQLRAYLQTDVRVDLSGPSAGHIAIRFYSNDDLDRVLELVLGRRKSIEP
jgi:ParB family chromosome partitioning protein